MVGDRELHPVQRLVVVRAAGRAARLRNPAEAARLLLHGAAALAELPGVAAPLAYESLRAGGSPEPLLGELAERCASRMVSAYARHSTARARSDGAELLAVAEDMAAIGAARFAVEAASEAAAAFVRDGKTDSARRAAARARELYHHGQGAELPRIDGLDTPAIALTAREEQLIDMARRGLSNSEIADRLVISVRTVETHLYRGMQKLGVRDRREL